ncbi:MAG: hypothetical protein A2020_14260 [Lentisphaerae bacterium GWF2_45_14]|nr:MAG: hypothetical protein A2020_14260 [Lentisphaerae bacterium GWF2_45_14]
MGKLNLGEIYGTHTLVVTAHRGFSGRFPENTLLAFREAVNIGADIIEFDLRGTKDIIPIVIHDPTLDRTSDGEGLVGNYLLSEIKKFNFSFWQGAHNTGRKLSSPAYDDIRIPTFQEVIDAMKGKTCMNIQLYDTTQPLLEKICRLYKEYDLYEDAYLTVGTYWEAEEILRIDKKSSICILNRQGNMTKDTLNDLKSFGCKYIQPFRADVTSEFCRKVKELSLCANMFFSDTEDDNKKFISTGIQGILSNYPDILLNKE